MEKMREKKEKEWAETLDGILGSEPIERLPEIELPNGEPDDDPPRRRHLKFIILGLAVLLLVLILYFRDDVTIFLKQLKCNDDTFYNRCSENKPYYCLNGTLIKKASVCGCRYAYRADGEECKKILRCNDGTIYEECSEEKPFYCSDGALITKSSVCGCPIDEVSQEESCIPKFQTGPLDRTLHYIFEGVTEEISITVYSGLNNYLALLPRSFPCDPVCPSNREMQLKYLDQDEQRSYLEDLVEKIESLTDDKDDQVRIAVSLVQHIPYDLVTFETDSLKFRYPYEVIHDNMGVCSEKSKLLAFLLREFGFGVVLFEYGQESHMAVGIKCPMEYSYKDGYCFIETAKPAIITNAQREYVGSGKLSSTPEVIIISDGLSFDSVSKEYDDAQEFIELDKLAELSGGSLRAPDYYRLLFLINKYGIEAVGITSV